jgi:hypothetical protein
MVTPLINIGELVWLLFAVDRDLDEASLRHLVSVAMLVLSHELRLLCE